MRIPVVVLMLVVISTSKCEHLFLGDVNGHRQLIHHATAEYNAIPWMKRVKNYFYNNEDQRIISAIIVYDNLHTNASATVTTGGIGFSYVNLRLKSERGKGLNYDIGIYS